MSNGEILRVSIPLFPADADRAGVNDCCHGWTGGLRPNAKHITRNPAVYVLFWGNYYETTPDAMTYGVQLVTDLVTGPFMNNLAEYGIGRGSVVGHGKYDANVPAPDTADLDTVKTWLKKSIKETSPAVNERNRVYLIFAPPTTLLTLKSDGTILTSDEDFGGYHQWDKYHDDSNEPDVFFGIIPTKIYPPTKKAAEILKSGASLIGYVSEAVGHELVEIFTDRDGNGFVSTECQKRKTCEVGDLCETERNTYHNFDSGQDWTVQKYWSNWNSACVDGNQPVSLTNFLKAIGFDYKHQKLSALGTTTINIQYIASRM